MCRPFFVQLPPPGLAVFALLSRGSRSPSPCFWRARSSAARFFCRAFVVALSPFLWPRKSRNSRKKRNETARFFVGRCAWFGVVEGAADPDPVHSTFFLAASSPLPAWFLASCRGSEGVQGWPGDPRAASALGFVAASAAALCSCFPFQFSEHGHK